MKYYLFAGKNELDFQKLNKFLFKTDKFNHFAIFVFNDTNYKEFYSMIDVSMYCLTNIGSDGALYYFDGQSIIKKKDKSPISINANWKRLNKVSKQIESDIEYCDNIRRKYGPGITCLKKSLFGYDKFIFVDSENGLVVPFRFHKARSDNQPLAVYFSGGGTLGHDNYKTLNEFLLYANGNDLAKSDCNIIIPQSMFSEANSEKESIECFVDSCSKMIRTFLKEYPIDNKRVYTFGMSLGGKCVWRAILSNPELFTVAVPAMGLIYDYRNENFEKIKDISIWLAHSSDDEIVKIDSDDYSYNKLKALGADVKYTRWDRYGHTMANRFYKSEDWVQWLLSKAK